MSASRLRFITIIGLMTTLALAPQLAFAQATPEPFGRTFELSGEQVYPEGIAYDQESNTFYVGSTTDGTIYQGNVETGVVEELVPMADPLPTAVGLEITDDGYLIVAGGGTGFVYIIDVSSGDVVRELTNGLKENTFLNDVAVVPGGDAYVTDSMTSILYRVPLGMGDGSAVAESGSPEATERLDEYLDFTGTPLKYTDGFNLNGIVSTTDGEYLIAVQSNTGQLFRIDVESKEVVEIAGLQEQMTAGDGLVIDDNTLYVVRNQLGEIAVVELDEEYISGSVAGSFSHPSLGFPTTAAKVNGCLLVVNSQFDRQQSGDPSLPFTVSVFPIPGEFIAPGSPTATASC